MSLKSRDFQKRREYRWEQSLRVKYEDALTKHQCSELAQRVHIAFVTPVPNVTFFDDNRTRRATGSRLNITLPIWARTSTVVVHECIHSVMDVPCNSKCAWHGPEFVRLFVETLVWLKLASRKDLLKSARAAGLHVAPYKSCFPKLTTKPYRRYHKHADVKYWHPASRVHV